MGFASEMTFFVVLLQLNFRSRKFKTTKEPRIKIIVMSISV